MSTTNIDHVCCISIRYGNHSFTRYVRRIYKICYDLQSKTCSSSRTIPKTND